MCRPCIAAAGTSSRFPARPTCPIACCARWRRPTIDHRGAEFAALGREVLDGLKEVFRTAGPVVIFPASGHRRVGSGARQHAVARRQGAGVRDRRVRAAVGAKWRSGSGWTSRWSCATGAAASIRDIVEAKLRADREHRSAPCSSCTTRPRRASRAGCPRSARPSTPREALRRCCSSTRSRRWARSICVTTSGASTSRWPDRRRG